MSEFGYSPNVRLGYTPGAPTSAAMHRERSRRGGRRSGEVRRQLRDLHGPRRLKRIRQVNREEFERVYREMCEREELVFDRRGLNSCYCLYVSLMARYRAQGNGYETTNAQTCRAMAARERPRCRRTVQRLRRRLAAMGVMDFHHVKRSGAERRPGELDSLRVILLHLRRAVANVTLRSWSEPALTGRRLRRKALSPPPTAADGERRRCAAPNGGNEDQRRTIREVPEDRQPYAPSRLEFLTMLEELAPGLMDGAQRKELAALRAESGSGQDTPRTASIAAAVERLIARELDARRSCRDFCAEHGWPPLLGVLEFPALARRTPAISGILHTRGRHGASRPAPGRDGTNHCGHWTITEVSAMIRETPVPQLRLSSSSTPEGWVEVTFLGRKIALTPDQAREFQRELTHSIAMATLRPAGVLA